MHILAAGCTRWVHAFSKILIPLYKGEHTHKLPGARFWLPMHPACAQKKTLISNTAYCMEITVESRLYAALNYKPHPDFRVLFLDAFLNQKNPFISRNITSDMPVIDKFTFLLHFERKEGALNILRLLAMY